jgi:hypothetical protein
MQAYTSSHLQAVRYHASLALLHHCIHRAAGFDPEHSGRKHVPLEQRVMDKSYEQRISDIQQGTSQRKARLDKNLAMQTVS